MTRLDRSFLVSYLLNATGPPPRIFPAVSCRSPSFFRIRLTSWAGREPSTIATKFRKAGSVAKASSADRRLWPQGQYHAGWFRVIDCPLYPDGQDYAFHFNINHADQENRLRWEEVRKVLDSRPPNAYWVIHNAPFDRVMLRAAVSYDVERYICTLQLAVSVYEPMPAQHYDPKRVKAWPIAAEPKLDGLRVQVWVDYETGEAEARSRNGSRSWRMPALLLRRAHDRSIAGGPFPHACSISSRPDPGHRRRHGFVPPSAGRATSSGVKPVDWFSVKRRNVNRRSPASSRPSATTRHFGFHLHRKSFLSFRHRFRRPLFDPAYRLENARTMLPSPGTGKGSRVHVDRPIKASTARRVTAG